jgi:CubicO group peptidase (beta-lactamase class C family)
LIQIKAMQTTRWQVAGMSTRISLIAGLSSVVLAVDSCSPNSVNASSTPATSGPWMQYASPVAAGFAADRLDLARRYADSVRSGAVMIVRRGLVVQAWGDVARRLELHSVRKSLVSALFGIAVDRKEIDIDRTLGAVGITDREPLADQERSARIRDLLAARSGVYLPAAYAAADQDSTRPARGSHPPNTFFFYNNWDFNVLGVIYERAVDSSLFRSLDERIARPIGMEDYTPADGFLVYEPSGSMHPAHTIRMSARDLARFGQLYLQGGVWAGRQVISRQWITESTTPKSRFSQGQGYGLLWWTASPGYFGPRYAQLDRRAVFYGSGTGGQLVLVIPSDDLVIVHRGDTDHGRNISGRDSWRIVEMILAAEQGTPTNATGAVPMSPLPFATQLPSMAAPAFVAIDQPLAAELEGRYHVGPNVVVQVFRFAGRLFANFPGQGEAELFALTRSEFTIRVQSGVRIQFERNDRGAVTGFSAQIGPQRFKGIKQ